MRTVIFGVDGLTFRILDPLIERGYLPNFRKLKQEGCEAILESKYPPLTPPAWTSLSTGLKPARHGVFDFWEYEQCEEAHTAPRARVQTRRKGGKAIWNILSEYGKQVLVINVPMTYPADVVNGIMIGGYMTPSSDVNFTYPTSFKEELFRVVPDYQIDLGHQDVFGGKSEGRANRLIDATLRMTERRIELIRYMLNEKPWDFCYLGFVGPDRLQHSLWEEVSSLDAKATEYFHLLDHALGLTLEQLGHGDCLFVVSDHGFQGVSRSFDINEYLYSKHLLALSSRTSEARSRASYRANLKQALKQLGLLSLARKTKRSLKKSGVLKQSSIDFYQPLTDGLDWERTQAYVPSHSSFPAGFANIFFDGELEPDCIVKLSEDLKHLVDPVSGKALISEIYTADIFGSGPYAPAEPHLLLLPNEGITFRVDLGNKWLWDDVRTGRDASKRFGVHHKDGVLYAYGDGIKRGFKAPSAEIYDLVPTVLHSMGLPLPYEFDGHVLSELFVVDKQTEQVSVLENTAAMDGLARSKLKKLQGV